MDTEKLNLSREARLGLLASGGLALVSTLSSAAGITLGVKGVYHYLNGEIDQSANAFLNAVPLIVPSVVGGYIGEGLYRKYNPFKNKTERGGR